MVKPSRAEKAQARFHELMRVMGNMTEKQWKEILKWLTKKK